MSRLKYAILTAAFMFAMALTFSCSRDSDENPFAQQYLYCVYPVEKTCVPGVVKECPQGGAPKDVCPAEFVEKAPSSSSTRGSSSSGGSNNDPFAGIPWWEYYKETLKYYNPDDRDQRCRNGTVEERCEDDGNEVWYNPLTHVCGGGGSDDCPPDSDCVPSTTTYLFGTIERCGNELYASFKDIICERCGSKYYILDEGYTRCRNGVIEHSCRYGENETWYNYETHSCYWDYETQTQTVKSMERCGSMYIESVYERCNNGVFEVRCGESSRNVWFNPITQSCDYAGTVKAKQRCGS